MNSTSLRIVFMGTPAFSVGIMESILNSNHQLVACVTVADKPSGRGQLMNESAVKKFAFLKNIPILQPVKLKDEDFLISLEQFQADIFIVVAFRMLPEEVWKMAKKGTFNLHASLLPDYRGAAPINWSIINGDTETGLSTFFIDDKIDTGDVLLQIKMTVGENENAGELHDRMILEGGNLVVQTLNGIANETLIPVKQKLIYIENERPAPKLFKENTKIDWNLDVKKIHDLVRGLSPYPVAWTTSLDKHNLEKSIRIFETRKSSEAGVAWWSNKKSLFFSNDSGTIEILSLQIEGKKRMSAQEWLAGNKIEDWKIG